MTKTQSTGTVYRVKVIRMDSLWVDTFYTGYPERDIATDRTSRRGAPCSYDVSVYSPEGD